MVYSERSGQAGRVIDNDADAESVRHNTSPYEANKAYSVAARDPFRVAQEVEPSSQTFESGIPPHPTILPHAGEEHACIRVYPSDTPHTQVDHTRGRAPATHI